jgi:microcystin-dependent protein
MQTGQGQGLSERFLGEMSGVESITLLVSEIPIHTHGLFGSIDDGDLRIPSPTRSLAKSAGGNIYNTATSPQGPMAFQSLPPAGGGLPHNNMQPYLALNFCIALQGIFPQRP